MFFVLLLVVVHDSKKSIRDVLDFRFFQLDKTPYLRNNILYKNVSRNVRMSNVALSVLSRQEETLNEIRLADHVCENDLDRVNLMLIGVYRSILFV